MQIKILSWNIWIHGNFDQISDYLQKAQADIIGLQEVVVHDPNYDVIGFLSKLGYQHVFAPVKKEWGGKTYADGPAIFSKFPIRKSEIYALSERDTRVAIRADVQINKDSLSIFCTHLLHTHQKESKEQSEQVKTLLKVLSEKRCVVMGDFNAIPQSTAIQKMKKQLQDTDPSSMPTWSVYPEGCITCKPQDIATRLDYIFTSKDIRVHSFAVGDSRGSDHLPIMTILEI